MCGQSRASVTIEIGCSQSLLFLTGGALGLIPALEGPSV